MAEYTIFVRHVKNSKYGRRFISIFAKLRKGGEGSEILVVAVSPISSGFHELAPVPEHHELKSYGKA